MSSWLPTRFRVRPANIPALERDIFERYGEQVVGLVLAGGLNPAAEELSSLYRDPEVKLHARDWLTERSHQKEQHETIGFWIEIGIVTLIGLELVLAVMGIREGGKQTKVLDQLNRSSAETAATLSILRKAQENSLDTQKHTLENIVTMNSVLEQQLDLNFADVLQLHDTSNPEGKFTLGYKGKVNLFLWGSRFGRQSPTMQKEPTELKFGGTYTFDISRQEKKLLDTTPDGAEARIPFALYFKADNGTKYLAESSVILTGLPPGK